jgi:hypothetical protein
MLKPELMRVALLREGWSLLRGRQQETLYKRHREYCAARRLLAVGGQ